MGLATTKDNGSDDGSRCCLTVWQSVSVQLLWNTLSHTHTDCCITYIKATCWALPRSAQFQSDLSLHVKRFLSHAQVNHTCRGLPEYGKHWLLKQSVFSMHFVHLHMWEQRFRQMPSKVVVLSKLPITHNTWCLTSLCICPLWLSVRSNPQISTHRDHLLLSISP